MKFAVWAPAIFSAFLCWGYLFLPQAKFAFLSFLPMAFFFVANFQNTLVSRIEQLEKRAE